MGPFALNARASTQARLIEGCLLPWSLKTRLLPAWSPPCFPRTTVSQLPVGPVVSSGARALLVSRGIHGHRNPGVHSHKHADEFMCCGEGDECRLRASSGFHTFHDCGQICPYWKLVSLCIERDSCGVHGGSKFAGRTLTRPVPYPSPRLRPGGLRIIGRCARIGALPPPTGTLRLQEDGAVLM